MKRKAMPALLAVLMLLSACAGGGGSAPEKDAIVTFQLSPSQEGVTEFLEQLEAPPSLYDNDRCYNVTPREIAGQYGFEIFKFDQSCAGYLLCGGQIHPLGEWFGGNGLVTFAVADLNGDRTAELYFTYSWGSGMHRSMVGYFDLAADEPVLFEYWNIGRDMILVAEGETLSLFNARFDEFRSFVELHAEAEDKVAELVYEDGAITLKELAAP